MSGIIPYVDITNKERLTQTLFRKAYCDLNTKCWIQPKKIGSSGYPTVKINKKSYLSHRLSAYLFLDFNFLYFSHKDKSCVLHTCDNKRCFNPEHLWIGSYKDNNLDCIKKGRNVKPFGEDHPTGKLTELQALEIIERCHQGERYSTLAKEYGVTPENIGRIFRGDSWKHLKAQRSDTNMKGKFSHLGKEKRLWSKV